ncbi:sigma-70 family RNA polymerase sigma factor [Propionicimonas sp.]|uniref:RNA polymerase sigma factor n=1 Tax=Propionicimonas sp. TaxID=1955623 RepID=UPI0025D9980B|nr:sigma-70 family RNA polymerase sigma factor [Propionicimonas sp.]MBU3976649.1 sigma-70 family RNA polymerase sigma factor [Actinomycetota bacterium]MBU3986524.1 sigma-70 family RNA polymerase sigma factor [Actinomycetota bacterium]MBU4007324.1 sigma-70 family RNA polymerase sigma factor [Actinomycetota bacterium]MBU4065077.1 sigma-70 family RNA polymerase sigma factor [Actinomycetota bacterium]MBU4094590.1 sigma-70 family RNA polymerase sigma factor [Actinomycetota bacterium]
MRTREGGVIGSDLKLEAECLAKVRGGDAGAFTEIVGAYRSVVFGFAAHLVGPADAEDLTSDVFERLLAGLLKGAGPTGPLRPYLLRMVRNAAVDVYRGRREIPQESVAADRSQSADLYEHTLEAPLVRGAFASIPQRWQQVLWLVYVEQHNRVEVAEELGMRPGAVSQLALRARDGFRAAYLAQYVGAAGSEHPAHLLPAYSLRKASKADAITVEQHVLSCRECRDALLEVGSIARHLGSALLVAVGPWVLTLPWRAAASLSEDRRPPGLATAASVIGGIATICATVILAFGAVQIDTVESALPGGLRGTESPLSNTAPHSSTSPTARPSTEMPSGPAEPPSVGSQPAASARPVEPVPTHQVPSAAPTLSAPPSPISTAPAPSATSSGGGHPTPTSTPADDPPLPPQPSWWEPPVVLPTLVPVPSFTPPASFPTGGVPSQSGVSWWEPPVVLPSTVPSPTP